MQTEHDKGHFELSYSFLIASCIDNSFGSSKLEILRNIGWQNCALEQLHFLMRRSYERLNDIIKFLIWKTVASNTSVQNWFDNITFCDILSSCSMMKKESAMCLLLFKTLFLSKDDMVSFNFFKYLLTILLSLPVTLKIF